MSHDTQPNVTLAPSEKTIFAAALECCTPQGRAIYPDAACGAEVPLRERVETLLHATGHASDFLEQPPPELRWDDVSQAASETLAEKPDDRIGR